MFFPSAAESASPPPVCVVEKMGPSFSEDVVEKPLFFFSFQVERSSALMIFLFPFDVDENFFFLAVGNRPHLFFFFSENNRFRALFLLRFRVKVTFVSRSLFTSTFFSLTKQRG